MLGLAPTTSTSVALAVADALAVVVSEQRGINAHQYAQSHPHGHLGEVAQKQVKQSMSAASCCVCVSPDASVMSTLLRLADSVCRIAAVLDADGRFMGVQSVGLLQQAFVTKKDVHIGVH